MAKHEMWTSDFDVSSVASAPTASVGKIVWWHMAQIRLESGTARLTCSTVIVSSTEAAARCTSATKAKWGSET